MQVAHRATAIAMVCLFGCRPADDVGSLFSASATIGSTSQTTASETGSSTDDTATTNTTMGTGDGDGDGDDDDGPLLDVLGGTADGNETDEEGGCEKVDFLFVIDNSGSMVEEQMALAISFPGFISTISDTLMAQDYHLMVTDTDAASVGAANLSIINGSIQCDPDPTCCIGVCNGIGGVVIQPPPTECNGEPCANYPLPTGCDVEIGAGKDDDQGGNPCGIAGDIRYMLDSQPNLEQTFSCLALVGTGGDGIERPMDALTESIGSQSAMGGCNEGFLRDDAVLVVVVITDEDDVDQSMGNPMIWKQTLVDAKQGNEEAIVMLGLVGDGTVMGGQCPADVDAPVLRGFAESFTYGQVGSVCAPDYAPFFEQAVAVIDTACDNYVPVG